MASHGTVERVVQGTTVRRDAGLYGYERALARRGLTPVAGVDEAGRGAWAGPPVVGAGGVAPGAGVEEAARGACAGPLVVGAAVLPPGKRGEIPELADSKLLTALARERVY